MNAMTGDAHHAQEHMARLVRMANQIGDFFESQSPEMRVPGIAEHIGQFWDKKMRRDIYAHVAAGGAGLHAPVIEAVRLVQSRDKVPVSTAP